MARLSQVSLRFAFAFIAVVLISGLELDSHLKSAKGSFGIVPAFAAATRMDPKDDVAATARLSSSYGKLPISFEPNQGQTAGVVQYLARGAGYTLFLTPGEMVLTLHASLPGARKAHGAPLPSAIMPPAVEGAEKSAAVRMRLIGSNKHAQALGVDPLPGKSNYLTGSDPAKWHTDIPTYAKVRYQDVYPGIDLVYYGNQEGKLEHDFVVAPGADPQRIEFDVRDEDGTPALNGGELTLHTRAGGLRLQAPVAYQVIGEERRPVPATYKTAGSGAIGFRVGSYDRHYPLVIDPVLVYTAVFGGSSHEFAAAMTIDKSRNVYVAGLTTSVDFPLVDPFQSDPGNIWVEARIAVPTAFVSKLNSTGTALLYSTYLGRPNSQANAIAVDATGRTYVSGVTGGDFPVLNAYQTTVGGDADAFVAVLNSTGNSLAWSTFIGGKGEDIAYAMALDSSGNVYVTGVTDGGFPALHSILASGTSGIWVAKFNSSGILQYSSLYAATAPLNWGPGHPQAITADSHGSAYISGFIRVPGYEPPTTSGAYQSTCPDGGGVDCAFVAKLSPAGDSLIYSTTMGPYVEDVRAIALDSDLSAYIGGCTWPGGMPAWSRGFQRQFAGGQWDGYVAKLNATGSNLIWSTYLGGSQGDCVHTIAIDQYRQVYVAGFTYSTDFPLKNPIQTYAGTSQDPDQQFVTTLSGSLGSIPYFSTYFGGSWSDWIGITVDPSLNIYLAGIDKGNIQPTPGAYSVGSFRLHGPATGFKVYISKLVIMDDLSLALNASPSPLVHGNNLTYTMAVMSKGPDFGVNVRVSDTLPLGTTFVSYDAGGGTCTAPPIGSTGTLNCVLAQLNNGATWNVKLVVHVNAASGATLSNTAATISNMQDFVISNNSAAITTRVN